MVELDTKLIMFSQLTRDRPFNPNPKSADSYSEELAKSGIDIIQELITRLRTQNLVTFYDIGCGDGLAADGENGIFEVVKRRLGPDEQDLTRKLFYVGIDLIEPQSSEGPHKKLLTYNIEEFRDIPYQLPRIDVGLSLWGFPYFEKKIESLESLTAHMNPNGMLVLCPFPEDLTIVQSDSGIIPTLNVYRQCFDASRQGGSLIIRGVKRPISEVVSFAGGEIYNNCQYAHNGRWYAQIVSRYRAVNPNIRAA